MEGIREAGFGSVADSFRSLSIAVLLCIGMAGAASAQIITQNVNVTGSPTPGYDWQLYRQENEVSCRPNPNNELIIICAYNWYGYSDMPSKLGDAWIGMSWARDAENFTHLPITGTIGKEYLGAGFAADPTVLTYPGGAIITSIVGERDGNSKMVAQRLVEMNRETGAPYALEKRQQEIASFNGVNFIDKPDAKIIIQPGGGFREVTITTDEIDEDSASPTFGEFKEETRLWPEFTVCVAYAVFGGSNQNIRTYATCSDDFGAEGTWSNPRQISQSVSGGLDQGMTIAALGDNVLYVARRFDSGDGDALIGALAKDRGYRPGKLFEITDICPFDQATAPSLENPDKASVRSLGFPWVSATDSHFVLAYVDRPRDALGNCLPSYEGIAGVGGTRVMLRTSTNGRNWSDPVPVLPFENQPIHFEFQPNIACARGACNVVYYSTLTESLAFDQLLGNSGAERYWETNDFIEDFDVFDGNDNQILRFRRSVDVYSTKIKVLPTGQTGAPQPFDPVRVSQYQIDYEEDGDAIEIEWNSLGNLIYGGMTAPFHGDYIANGVSDWRKNPISGEYESNAGPIGNIDDPINRARFFAAWTDNRRIRGFVYDDNNYKEDGNPPMALPYEVDVNPEMTSKLNENVDEANEAETPVQVADTAESKSMVELLRDATPGGPMGAARAAAVEKRPDRFASAYALSAEGLKDRNLNPGICSPGTETNPDPTSAFPYPGVQTNVKNSEIYGAVIENEVRLVSPNVGKPFNKTTTFGTPLQRGFVIGVDNTSPDAVRTLRLVIANQPSEAPQDPSVYDETTYEPTIFGSARASWRQLPYRPTFTSEPAVFETVVVEPLSLEFVTLFVVATVNDSPITVYAYDESDNFVSQITVNGQTEAGELIDPGTTAESVNLVEIHDPNLIPPDWAELEILPLAADYENPNFRSPNFRSPNFRSTNYMNPNLRSPNFRSLTYESVTVESTSLQNPNLRSPNLRSDSFVDVTYTVTSDNNTITAVNADFAYGGNELDGTDVQVIAWQEDQLATAQGCDDGFITESKVISAKANPNFRSLAPADILDPFQGEVSFPLTPDGPGSRVNLTVRIFCNEQDLDPVSGLGECSDLVEMNQEQDPEGNPTSKLQNLLGYNFWAQKANTGKDEINTENEQIIKDVIPPMFDPELVDGTTYSFDTTGSDPDAAATIDLVAELGLTAYDNCDPATQEDCSGSEVGVTCSINDIDSAGGIDVPLGESMAQCETEADAQENTNEWEGSILIEDNVAPMINIPATELIVAPDNAEGAVVNYEGTGVWEDPTAEITFTDNISKEGYDYPQLSCLPASGSTFGFNTPTTVTCTVADAGPCDPDVSSSCVVGEAMGIPISYNETTATFTVTVQDNDAPVISCIEGDNGCVLSDIVEEASATDEAGGTTVTLTAPTAIDPDGIDPSPSVGAYVDANCETPAPTKYLFGTTVITWCATDFAGNTGTLEQNVIIVDTTDPVVTVSFPGGSPQDTNSLSGKPVSFDVNIDDLFPDALSVSCESAPGVPINSGDIFPVGDTTVTCHASDLSGNSDADGGSAMVTVLFVYSSSGISGKSSGKNGSSFPLEWAWLDGPGGSPVTVSQQTLSIVRGNCATSSSGAQDPGSSGLRQNADGSYTYNLLAVDPLTGQPWENIPNGGEDFCFSVSLPTGETQQKPLTIRP